MPDIEALLADLSAFYEGAGIDPLDFRCPNRSACSAGCDDFTEARASLVGDRYGAPIRLVVLSLDRGGHDKWRDPKTRTLQAVRERQTIERLRSLNRGRHWYKTHATVAGLLGLASSEDAVGRFAHVNAAKCTQNKPGKKVADRKLFDNCGQFAARELEILNEPPPVS